MGFNVYSVFRYLYVTEIYIHYIYIYTHVIICIYIWLMLKILYYFGMLKNLWIFCDLCYCICLLFQNDPFFHPSTETSTDGFFLIFGPGTASVSSYPPFKWCSVCFGKMMWTLVCVQRYVCLCELIYTTYVWCMYMIYIYMCVIWQTRRTFLMMMHIYLRMLICIFPSKKVKTMAEDLPHSVDVKEKTWSFRHRTRTADHRRKLTRSSGSTWIWWISSWVSYGTPSIGSDDAKTSEKKGQQKRHDVWRSAWASWRKRCIKNFERFFFWLCGS